MIVVAAALVSDGRVLAARRRTYPAATGWEFPGGKVEPGEAAAAAIERECAEELGMRVRAVAEVAVARDDRIALHLWHVEPAGGTPAAGADHDELRWLGAADLAGIGWLPLDRELLPVVRELLTRGG